MFLLWFGFHLYFPSCKDGLQSCIVAFFGVRQSTDKCLHPFVWFYPLVCSEATKLKFWGVHCKSPSVWSSLCRTVYVQSLKLEGFLSHWSMIWDEHLFIRAGLSDITNCLDVNNDLVSQLTCVSCGNLKPPPHVLENNFCWSRKQFESSSF